MAVKTKAVKRTRTKEPKDRENGGFGYEVDRNGRMLHLQITIASISPMLQNRMSQEALEALPGGPLHNVVIKSPQGTKVGAPTAKEKADLACHRTMKGAPAVTAEMLMGCLMNAGRHIKLDGKRQLSTKKGSLLPGMFDLDAIHYPLTTKAGKPCEVQIDIRRGKQESGSALCLIRARFDEWQLTFEALVDGEQIDEVTIRQLVDIGGQRVGLGSNRPETKGQYGRFKVIHWTVMNGK